MDLNCPYCDADLNVNHDDGFGYEENTNHEMECRECEKRFVFTTSISFYYEAKKADCLNDAPHEYELTHTFPVEFSEMRCNHCGDERELTNEERLLFGIGSKESCFELLG